MVTDLHVPSIDATGEASGAIDQLEVVPIPRTTSAQLASDASVLRHRAGWLVEDTDSLQRRTLTADLDGRQLDHQKRPAKDLLSELSEAGFSWRDIARLAGVSVPAVQKWRRGTGVAAANHAALAKVVAMTEMLRDHGVFEVASWLEIPLKEGVSLSRMDMLIAGRYDLVTLSSANGGLIDTDAILDEFDPEWRTTRVDNEFETFVDAEGILSIRPRPAR